MADLIEATDIDPYIFNALCHVNAVRSTVHDGLTGRNDSFLKESLLLDIDAIEHNLKAALK